MSGSMTVACRFSDGEMIVSDSHSRHGYDIYAYAALFDGDENGARSYLKKLEDLKFDQGIWPLREDEYGVLIVDFVDKKIIIDRPESLTRHMFFLPQKFKFDREMGKAGRVSIKCSENTFEPFLIETDMLDDWMTRVHPENPHGLEPTDLPLPAHYFVRLPETYVSYDFSPWQVYTFNDEDRPVEFWHAAEIAGFEVDREGWLSRFDDDLHDEDEEEDA